MPMRDVKPLNAEQWAFVMKKLKEGPTDEQKQFMKEIRERFKNSEETK